MLAFFNKLSKNTRLISQHYWLTMSSTIYRVCGKQAVLSGDGCRVCTHSANLRCKTSWNLGHGQTLIDGPDSIRCLRVSLLCAHCKTGLERGDYVMCTHTTQRHLCPLNPQRLNQPIMPVKSLRDQEFRFKGEDTVSVHS